MILVTVLANLLTVLIGRVAQTSRIANRYQMNSAKNKEVLSCPFLGRRVIKRGIRFTKQQWLETLNSFHQLIEQKIYELL